MTPLAVLVLADGRFPTGAHAHSGGLEQAVDDGRVRDLATLAVFLDGRVRTQGLVDAGLAAATVARGPVPPWEELDAEAVARTPSPAQREVGRRLGRQLLRSAARVWVLPTGTPPDPLPGVALGAAALGGGARPADAALVATYHAASGPATAAVRLLGLDPVAVHALVATMPAVTEAAAEATAAADGELADLPSASAALLEIAAERHLVRQGRLFAS